MGCRLWGLTESDTTEVTLQQQQPPMQETWFNPLEKEMATHSSVLAWRIPWTEGPDGLQSMGSVRVGHD